MRVAVLLAAFLAAITVSGAAAAPGTERAKEKNFRARLVGSARIISLPGGTQSLQLEGRGHGNIGISQFTFSGGFDFHEPPGPRCTTFSGGAFIITTRRSGQIVLYPRTGQARMCAAPGGQSLTVSMDIVIGTGRFDGITGQARLTGSLIRLPSGAFLFEGELNGTVTRPRDDDDDL